MPIFLYTKRMYRLGQSFITGNFCGYTKAWRMSPARSSVAHGCPCHEQKKTCVARGFSPCPTPGLQIRQQAHVNQIRAGFSPALPTTPSAGPHWALRQAQDKSHHRRMNQHLMRKSSVTFPRAGGCRRATHDLSLVGHKCRKMSVTVLLLDRSACP